VSTFELHEPHVILLSTICTYTCFIFNTLEKSRMGTRLLESGGVRLVINQSTIPVDLECSPEEQSCLNTVYCLRLYLLY
jgi:hypothetical protein